MEALKINDKTVKDNLKILLAFIFILAIGALLFLGIATLFISAIYKPWISSSMILISFLMVIWNMEARASWKQYGVIIVCVTAFAGCVFNMQGNFIYNLPIEWVYNGIGQLDILNETEKIGSEYIINYAFRIVDGDGTVVKSISKLAIIAFRFFEYIAIYSLLLAIFVPVINKIKKHTPEKIFATEQKWDNWEELQKQELHKREQIENESRQINNDIDKTIRTLMSEGKTIQAIKIVRQHTSLSLKEAKELVENINNSSH